MRGSTCGTARSKKRRQQRQKLRGIPGIEPGTSRTQSENHATRPNPLIHNDQNFDPYSHDFGGETIVCSLSTVLACTRNRDADGKTRQSQSIVWLSVFLDSRLINNGSLVALRHDNDSALLSCQCSLQSGSIADK